MATDYAETSILLAVMEGREDDAKQLIESMLPNERRAFRQAIGTLDELVDEVIDDLNENIPFTDSIRRMIQR